MVEYQKVEIGRGLYIQLAREETQFTAYGHVTGSGGAELYETPANNTAYITDIHSAVMDTDASWGGKIQLRDGEDTVVHSINHMAEGTGLSGAPQTIFHNFALPLILPVGYDIYMLTNAATTEYDVAVHGWVE